MKDEQLDQFFRSAIENMDGLPPQVNYWDKEYSFGKIQEGLNGNDSHRSRSFFDLAAAAVVSVVALAYGVSFFVSSHSSPVQQQNSSQDIVVNAQPLALQDMNNNSGIIDFSNIETAIEEPAADVLASLKPFSFSTVNDENNLSLYQHRNDVEATSINSVSEKEFGFSFITPFSKSNSYFTSSKNSKKLSIELPIGISISGTGVAPVIAAQATLNLSKSGRHQKQISAAIAAYNTFQQNEGSKTTISPVLFAESSFGVVNNPDGFVSGHAVGAGYQLNDSDVYEGKAVKFNYTISVKKRLKVSAEAIVSEGFGKVHPGFKVTFI
ncbi:hypothetical protein [Chondrinema litorale]|uniref:hypothetical protein n=1 Tax=Chondrinema litorale TaxID=2994555 RepID=UPI0025436F77|nr:hypothetical protein [Chondrinema litorale]UZR92951.1 hypothetical protein OQ292_13900 [Chondrinema litorale]